MHTNYRRKQKYNNPDPRCWGDLVYWRNRYWTRERARVRNLMAHARFDDCQIAHPKCVAWNAH